MKAVRYHEFGGPEVLRYEEVPDPEPGPSDVLVDVVVCAVGRLDVLLRRGSFTLPGFALPHIAGMGIAGVISEVGVEAQHLNLGDRVVVNPTCTNHTERSHTDKDWVILGGNAPGGYAERCLVPASNVYLVPPSMSLQTAAGFSFLGSPGAGYFGSAWQAFCASNPAVDIHAKFGLADAAQAHAEMLAETCVGRVMLEC